MNGREENKNATTRAVGLALAVQLLRTVSAFWFSSFMIIVMQTINGLAAAIAMVKVFLRNNTRARSSILEATMALLATDNARLLIMVVY